MGLVEPRSSVPKVSMAPGSCHHARWNWPGWPSLIPPGLIFRHWVGAEFRPVS